MKTQIQKVSLASARSGDSGILDTANGVSANLYKATVDFPSPPVEQTELDAAIEALETAKAAMVQGGTAATAQRNLRRQELYNLLRKLANYVDEECGNDLAILLTSGFEAASTNRLSDVLPAPDGIKLRNGSSRQTLATIASVRNSRGYELEYTTVNEETKVIGEWIQIPFVTSSRNIPVNNLVSGQLYIYRARVLGGTAGHSDWSETITHRAY